MFTEEFDRSLTVFRLEQGRGLVVEESVRRSECDWPLTLEDCQAALRHLLPLARQEREYAQRYGKWVALTRTEMCRLYESHRQDCRQRQEWDLRALLALRCRLEVLTLRLYCAPWMPARVALPSLALARFSRLTA